MPLENRAAGKERERCLAILEAFRHNLGDSEYLWLWNRMNNPDHDPRKIPDEELALMGYKPAKKKAKRKK